MSSVTIPAAAVRARLPVPPPLTNSSPPRSATSRTAATIPGSRERMSRSERDCMQRIAALRSGLPGIRSPTPAIWPS